MAREESSLAGCRVLVTRPVFQASRLMELVRRAGGDPIPFPTLEILPIEPSPEQIDLLARAEIAIFISANAVEHGYPFLGKAGSPGKKLVAIGPSTKRALEALGCVGVHGPDDRSSSETLLEHPVTQDVDGMYISIVRGQGGRETLQRSLMARGARVSYLECYRRRVPQHWDSETIAGALADTDSVLVVTATSVAGLSSLLEMVPPAIQPQLMSRALAVIGGRQKESALRMGWQGPVLESGAGDNQIVESIARWRDQSR